ncbi:MAG: amino acid ABC transporter permease [Erysipelotrichaceae bacterium]
MILTSIPSDFFGGVFYIFNKYAPLFFQGMQNTLLIALSGTLIGLVLGMMFAALKTMTISKREPLLMRIMKRTLLILSNCYIEIFRGTPMIVQASFFYYGLISIGVKMNPLVAGIIVVSVNTGAYMAEILRAGIQSVDVGQKEAAASLGMNNWQTMLFIILPQALRNALPAIGNEFVVNIKDTSVLNVISVTELYFQSGSVGGITYRFFETFFITAVLYFVMTFTTTRILNYIEKRLDQPKTSFPASATSSKMVISK